MKILFIPNFIAFFCNRLSILNVRNDHLCFNERVPVSNILVIWCKNIPVPTYYKYIYANKHMHVEKVKWHKVWQICVTCNILTGE